eukprot:7317937-Prymnesium_polylepis.2
MAHTFWRCCTGGAIGGLGGLSRSGRPASRRASSSPHRTPAEDLAAMHPAGGHRVRGTDG